MSFLHEFQFHDLSCTTNCTSPCCVAESLLPILIYGWHRIVHHIGKDLNIVSADHVVHQSVLFSSPIPSPSAVTSRSASWAQLSRSGSIFVSSASKCFAWELRRNNGPCSGFESIDSMKTDELNTKQASQWNVQQARLDDPQSSKAYCLIAFRSNPSWDNETRKKRRAHCSAPGLDEINFLWQLGHLKRACWDNFAVLKSRWSSWSSSILHTVISNRCSGKCAVTPLDNFR